MRVALLVLATSQALVAPSLRQPAVRQGATLKEQADDAATLVPAESGAPGELVKTSPAIITFDPIETLVTRAVPLGLTYRDALLMWTGLMLPRPDIFQDAYDAALSRNLERAPRFGAGVEPLEVWWKRVTREMYEAVLVPDVYDQDERALLDDCFDDLFAELHGSLLIGTEAWNAVPGADRILGGLREWRDMRGGPRVAVVSTQFDSRLSTLLKNVLGDDAFYATFDFVATDCDNKADAFEIARTTHGFPDDRCLHVRSNTITEEKPATQLQEIATGLDVKNIAPDLTDLVDIWDLPRMPEDDLVTTTRLYSVYDKPPEYDDPPLRVPPLPDAPVFSSNQEVEE